MAEDRDLHLFSSRKLATTKTKNNDTRVKCQSSQCLHCRSGSHWLCVYDDCYHYNLANVLFQMGRDQKLFAALFARQVRAFCVRMAFLVLQQIPLLLEMAAADVAAMLALGVDAAQHGRQSCLLAAWPWARSHLVIFAVQHNHRRKRLSALAAMLGDGIGVGRLEIVRDDERGDAVAANQAAAWLMEMDAINDRLCHVCGEYVQKVTYIERGDFLEHIREVLIGADARLDRCHRHIVLQTHDAGHSRFVVVGKLSSKQAKKRFC